MVLGMTRLAKYMEPDCSGNGNPTIETQGHKNRKKMKVAGKNLKIN